MLIKHGSILQPVQKIPLSLQNSVLYLNFVAVEAVILILYAQVQHGTLLGNGNWGYRTREGGQEEKCKDKIIAVGQMLSDYKWESLSSQDK